MESDDVNNEDWGEGAAKDEKIDWGEDDFPESDPKASAWEGVEEDFDITEKVEELAISPIKKSAQVLGLRLFDPKATSEGMAESKACKIMQNMLTTLSNETVTSLDSFKKLKEGMECTTQSKRIAINSLEEGKPVILPCGWKYNSQKGHSIGLYAMTDGNSLVIIHCNRGDGYYDFQDLATESAEIDGEAGEFDELKGEQEGEPGVVVFKVENSTDACKELAEYFLKKPLGAEEGENRVSMQFYQDFSHYLKKYDAQKLGTVPLKGQSIGNCTIANKKGLLAGIEAYEKGTYGNHWQGSAAQQNYKLFTAALRKQEILEIIDSIKDQPNPLKTDGGKLLLNLIENKLIPDETSPFHPLKEHNIELVQFTISNLMSNCDAATALPIIKGTLESIVEKIHKKAIFEESNKNRATLVENSKSTTKLITELEPKVSPKLS